MNPRKSDSHGKKLDRFVRNSRFKETTDGWFFLTREGMSLGPYATMFDAELSASLLVARLAQLEPGVDAKPVIQEFLTNPSNPIVRPSHPMDPMELNRLRRKQRRAARAELVQRAWSTISNLSAIQKLS